MKFLSTTRPILFVAIIRDDTESGIFIRLLELFFMLHLFIWQHKEVLLRLFQNVNLAFDWLQAIKQTVKEIKLHWQYRYSLLLNPFPYMA